MVISPCRGRAFTEELRLSSSFFCKQSRRIRYSRCITYSSMYPLHCSRSIQKLGMEQTVGSADGADGIDGADGADLYSVNN